MESNLDADDMQFSLEVSEQQQLNLASLAMQ